jgi:hypothetical protein
MHGARNHLAATSVRQLAARRVCACIIDRSFVVIRLKHLAV